MQQGRLAGRVEIGVRLVENDQDRIAVDGARQADALALTGRQPSAAGADPHIVALRQRENVVVHRGAAGRTADRVRRRIGIEARNILRDRAVEQFDVLRHVADLAAHLTAVPDAQIRTVKSDRAALRLPKPEQHMRQRRLAGRARADHAERLARVELETDVLEDRPLYSRRRGTDAAQLDPALRGRKSHFQALGRIAPQQILEPRECLARCQQARAIARPPVRPGRPPFPR